MATVFDLLKGKKVKVITDMKIEVELKIKSVKNVSYERQITPDTPQNDWWGETKTITQYEVGFENGSSKIYKLLEAIEFFE